MVFLKDALAGMAGLAAGTVHAVITDPPYCSGGLSEADRKAATYQGLRSETVREGRAEWFANDNMGTAGIVWLLRMVATEAARVLVSGGSMLVFTDWRMVTYLAPALESSGLKLQNLVMWDKGSAGLGWGFRPQHEMVIHLVKGTGKYYSRSTSNVLRCKRVNPRAKHHPTEKPVEIMREMIETVTPRDGLVVDPFAGSGTTLVAASLCGRIGLGFEREPRYVDVANARIAAAMARGHEEEASG